MMEKRVVITGLGAITPIGKTVDEMWDGIKNKVCGVDKLTLFDNSNFKTKLAAEIKEYNPTDYFEFKASKRLDKSSQFAIIAAREAVLDSNITKENTDFDRVGMYISSGIGGIQTIQEQVEILDQKGNTKISPLFIPKSIPNMACGNVSIEFGFKGESMAILTACASSTHAIGEAYKTIKQGYEDIILAGGTEAGICEIGVAGFENMKALSQEVDPSKASRPFDKNRDGFVMAEGSGILVLEELEHAKKRNAKIYAEVVGFGATTDAYHITSPCLDGECAAKAMTRAMLDANIKPSQIDYINAHGTSTKLNDLTETKAIKQAFKDDSKNVLVSSVKGNLGHLLGAAGAVEAITCVKAINDSLVPPTINYSEKDEECDLDVVPNEPRKKDLIYTMSNSLGFGGHNASIIIKKYETEK